MSEETKTAEWYEQQLANYRRELDELNPQLDQARATIGQQGTQLLQSQSAVEQVQAVNAMQAAQIEELKGQLDACRGELSREMADHAASRQRADAKIALLDESARESASAIATLQATAARRMQGIRDCLRAGSAIINTAAAQLVQETEG